MNILEAIKIVQESGNSSVFSPVGWGKFREVLVINKYGKICVTTLPYYLGGEYLCEYQMSLSVKSLIADWEVLTREEFIASANSY